VNDIEDPNDSAVLSAVHDSISGLRMPAAPRLEAITARGRRHQRRRLGGLSLAGAGACAALVAGLVSAGGPGSAVSVGASGSPEATPQQESTSAELAAFTVSAGPGGTTTLILSQAQVINPDAVRRALAEHGIPAVVTADKFCRTADQPAPGVGQVVDLGQPPAKPALHGPPAGPPPRLPDGPGKIVIHGSAIPAGVKLSIGYRQDPHNREISFTLIKAGAPVTCTSIPDHGPHGDD
jgi:hypothetical protein